MGEIVWFDEAGEFTQEAWEKVKAMRAQTDARVLRAVRGAQMADQFQLGDVLLGHVRGTTLVEDVVAVNDHTLCAPVEAWAPANRHERRKQAKLRRNG